MGRRPGGRAAVHRSPRARAAIAAAAGSRTSASSPRGTRGGSSRREECVSLAPHRPAPPGRLHCRRRTSGGPRGGRPPALAGSAPAPPASRSRRAGAAVPRAPSAAADARDRERQRSRRGAAVRPVATRRGAASGRRSSPERPAHRPASVMRKKARKSSNTGRNGMSFPCETPCAS